MTQEELVADLWTVYYGNPLFDGEGKEREETHAQVLARALIAVLSCIELPAAAEIPK